MKRLTYLSALLCAAALAGCSNEELMESGAAMQQNELTLTAPPVRTHVLRWMQTIT